MVPPAEASSNIWVSSISPVVKAGMISIFDNLLLGHLFSSSLNLSYAS